VNDAFLGFSRLHRYGTDWTGFWRHKGIGLLVITAAIASTKHHPRAQTFALTDRHRTAAMGWFRAFVLCTIAGPVCRVCDFLYQNTPPEITAKETTINSPAFPGP
jgi:hypothetical protein